MGKLARAVEVGDDRSVEEEQEKTTTYMVDYEVAAHMLGECERRVVEAEIYLQAKIDALQIEYDLLAKEVPKKEKEEVCLEKIIIETGARFKAILVGINMLQRRNEEFLVDSQRCMDEVEPNLKSAIIVVKVLQNM
uniref:GTD-binding domain-containing protein n=1 Tax=Oryza rufipogon TaxID=4529 RepID=A0A0E0P823_ORYRU